MVKNTISIIVPAYNSEKEISRALCSLINQSYADLEVIVVNDGSTDKTAEIVKEISLKDTRINLINKRNGGVSSARNVGLKVAHGKYVMFMDSDDYVDENFCLRMVEGIMQSRTEMASCGAVAEDENGKILYHLVTTECVNFDRTETMLSIMRKGGISTAIWNKIFLNEIIRENNLSFDINVKCGEDLLFLANYVNHIERSLYIAGELYHYVIGFNTLSHSCGSKFCFNRGRMTEELAYKQIIELYSSEEMVIDQVRINLLNLYATLLIEIYVACEMDYSLSCEYQVKLRRILADILINHQISIFGGQISIKDYFKAILTVISPRKAARHYQNKNKRVVK